MTILSNPLNSDGLLVPKSKHHTAPFSNITPLPNVLVGFHGLQIFLPPTATERASKGEVFWDDTWELSVLSHNEVSLFHEVLHRPFGLGAGSEGFREVEVPSVIGTPLP